MDDIKNKVSLIYPMSKKKWCYKRHNSHKAAIYQILRSFSKCPVPKFEHNIQIIDTIKPRGKTY